MSSTGGASAPEGGGSGCSVRSGAANRIGVVLNAALVSRLMQTETPAGSSAAHARRATERTEVKADPTPATPAPSGVDIPSFQQPRLLVVHARSTQGTARYYWHFYCTSMNWTKFWRWNQNDTQIGVIGRQPYIAKNYRALSTCLGGRPRSLLKGGILHNTDR